MTLRDRCSTGSVRWGAGMENQDSHLPAKVESADQSKGQTSVQVDSSILGFCSLQSSNEQELEVSQTSLEKSPGREVQKPGPGAGAARWNQEGNPSRERDSSVDSTSSRVAPHNWRTKSSASEAEEADFGRATISTPLDDLASSSQQPQTTTTARGNRQSVDRNKRSESSDESYTGSRDVTHRAYWAELQNRLPLPLANLMEQEALEILTKSLRSYNKGIGKDHKLTQQLQRHVDQLRKNLKGRHFN